MNMGGYQRTEKIAKPVDSIRFGQSIDYKTENQTHFMRHDSASQINTNNGGFRDKFTKPNIQFGNSPGKNATQPMAKDSGAVA